jgi:hypothetical protein
MSENLSQHRGSGLAVDFLAHDGFQSPGDIPAREQDPSSAAKALQTDVSAQADDDPVRAATRMWFAESQHIPHLKIR